MQTQTQGPGKNTGISPLDTDSADNFLHVHRHRINNHTSSFWWFILSRRVCWICGDWPGETREKLPSSGRAERSRPAEENPDGSEGSSAGNRRTRERKEKAWILQTSGYNHRLCVLLPLFCYCCHFPDVHVYHVGCKWFMMLCVKSTNACF